jgi:hypothetical protein
VPFVWPFVRVPFDECPFEECPFEECPFEECPFEECPFEECPFEECPFMVGEMPSLLVVFVLAIVFYIFLPPVNQY